MHVMQLERLNFQCRTQLVSRSITDVRWAYALGSEKRVTSPRLRQTSSSSSCLVRNRLRVLRAPTPSSHQDRRLSTNGALSDHAARRQSRLVRIAPRRQPHTVTVWLASPTASCWSGSVRESHRRLEMTMMFINRLFSYVFHFPFALDAPSPFLT